MAELKRGDRRIVNKPNHWAHGACVEILDVGGASSIDSRSPLVEVRFPDSLGHGSEMFDAGELLPADAVAE